MLLRRFAVCAIRRDGEPPQVQTLPVGQESAVDIPITRAGPTVADVMLGRPRTLPAEASVAVVRAVLADDGPDHERLGVRVISDQDTVLEDGQGARRPGDVAVVREPDRAVPAPPECHGVPAGQPGEAVDHVADRAALREDRPLARGADIVIAEAVVEAGLELHAVLPFDIEAFIEESVATGDAASARWRERFEDVITRCTAVTIVQPGRPLTRDLDISFRHGFRYAAAQTIERAADLETTPLLYAITARGPSGELAGTSADIADWMRSGHEVVRIDMPFRKLSRSGPSHLKHGFAPCVFFFPDPSDSIPAMERVASVIEAYAAGYRRVLGRGATGLGKAVELAMLASLPAIASCTAPWEVIRKSRSASSTCSGR